MFDRFLPLAFLKIRIPVINRNRDTAPTMAPVRASWCIERLIIAPQNAHTPAIKRRMVHVLAMALDRLRPTSAHSNWLVALLTSTCLRSDSYACSVEEAV